MVAKIKKERKILVTGAAGMLGIALSEELSGEYIVRGLDLVKTDNFVTCDITNAQDILKCTLSVKPDFIIHTAAWTDVDGCEIDVDKATKINAVGTRNVSACASKLDIPLVYISTDFVFDGKKICPYKEDDKTGPLSVYAKSKLNGETAVIEKISEGKNPKKYLIIRSGWLYGHNGKNFVDTILDSAKNKKMIEVVSDQIGTPTYTKDLAKAIRKLVKLLDRFRFSMQPVLFRDRLNGKPETVHETVHGIYHISNNGEVSWSDYAKEILKLAGIKGVEVVPISSKKLGRPAKRPEFSVLDNSKFEKVTGFKMRPWKEALREYINEY